ncbi:sulfurtransferase complex subunit TusD [Shewanella corallii]|uniref:Sulfurtransferase complex subunit TusD n=2 Tax=Shewanella TaxID=22 RepID=A0ABT0NC58_9GAMM|nr:MULTISPECIES: sulfurtransferase complex subunit TusD [Shewanella]MCL1038002.1 sulfurtransferase complex subunit TusD [Shewanella submarina]MCL2916009.1 sulfurtransferase complex subunit TusD [Shewanella corallii]
MSKFIIQVNGSVYGDNAGVHALKFTQSALAAGHEVVRVFFYQEGVSHSNTLLSPASDEFNLHQAWCDLANQHSIELVNCVSAALRRGILSEQDAKEQQAEHWNTSAPFINGGLGELVTGIEQADRLICF